AIQFWTRRRTAVEGQASTALGRLVVIFVFCAICGYLPRLISIPIPLLLLAHGILATSAWAYMLAGHVDRLSVAVDNADSAVSFSHLADMDVDAETEACARLAEQLGSRATAEQIRQRLSARQKAGLRTAGTPESVAAATA
ncbi:MAG: hypothetical protein M3N39_04465, partial [Pseudomonadota bacterium]|nr:hypothetical protein [Pseudomonadota bacterium]